MEAQLVKPMQIFQNLKHSLSETLLDTSILDKEYSTCTFFLVLSNILGSKFHSCSLWGETPPTQWSKEWSLLVLNGNMQQNQERMVVNLILDLATKAALGTIRITLSSGTPWDSWGIKRWAESYLSHMSAYFKSIPAFINKNGRKNILDKCKYKEHLAKQ